MTAINVVGITLSGQSGSGSFAGKNSSTFTTPTIGSALATSLNLGTGPLKTYLESIPYTPIFSFQVPGDLSVVYTIQTGFYNQIGRYIFFTIQLNCTITFTSATGSALLSVPLQTQGGGGSLNVCPCYLTSPITYTNVLYKTLFLSPLIGTSNLQFSENGPSINKGTFNVTNVPTGSTINVLASGIYQANSGT